MALSDWGTSAGLAGGIWSLGYDIYTRFNRWSKAGVWQHAFSALRVDIDDEWSFIDSTIVKAHQHAARAKI